jgi:hypothetical protein
MLANSVTENKSAQFDRGTCLAVAIPRVEGFTRGAGIMKRVGLFFTISVFLTACTTMAPSGHTIIGPDGTANEVVSCGLIDDCYSFTRQVCGGTYKIVNSNSDTYSSGGGGRFASTNTDFIILAKCDSGKASYPDAVKPASPGTIGTNNANAEFPQAHSFKDCEKYESLYKDRCREEVYGRAHPQGQ